MESDMDLLNFNQVKELLDSELKQIKVNKDGKDLEMDIYVIENILPIVSLGLKDLSKHIEEIFLLNNVTPDTKERFNPLTYLAQYLMRNNPKYNEESRAFCEKFSGMISKLRKQRILDEKKFQIKVIFDMNMKEKIPFDKKILKLAVQYDGILKQNSHLKNFMMNSSKTNDENITFEEVYELISQYIRDREDLKISDLQQASKLL